MPSLRARLLLLVLVVLVPSFALLLLFVSREREVRADAARASALQFVDEGVRNQQEEVADGLRILRAFSMIASVRTGDAETCIRTLATLSEMIEEGWSLVRTRRDGIQDCATRGVESLPRDVSDNPIFLRARNLEEPLVGAYVRSISSGELVLPVNVPLRNDAGASDGMLSGGLRLRWFNALASRMDRIPGSVVSISRGADSLLLRHPALDPESVRPSPAHPIGSAMLREGRGVVDAPGLDGVPRVWAFDRLPSPDTAPVWLSVGLPASTVYEAANRYWRVALLGLGGWLVLVALVSWWGAGRFVIDDVRTLLSTTERIGSGELSARTGRIAQTDELARLAAGIDDMAARLQERQDREAQAQKLESIGQLAGGVAHDFNNLLTAIIGNTELARAALAPGHPAREELDEALGAAARSTALTRQLLAFARRSELAPRVVRVDALLHDLVALLRRLIGEHITLALDVQPDLALARIDPTSVEQAIVNLVVNARDAMPSGGTVRLSAATVSVQPGDAAHARGVAAGRWLRISVEDEGTGMSPAVQARAFEPFFTTKPVGKGTGLGLAMVYGTLAQHRGHVTVDSAEGRGTAVHLYFVPAPADARPEPEVASPLLQPVREAVRVLLVEDEAAVRSVIARVLRQHGYQVLTAEHGADALARCDDATLSDRKSVG